MSDDDNDYDVVADEVSDAGGASAQDGSNTVDPKPGTTRSHRRAARPGINRPIVLGAAAIAFCAVVLPGILVLLHSRSASTSAPDSVAPTAGDGDSQDAGTPDVTPPPPDLVALSASISFPRYFPPERDAAVPVAVADPRVAVELMAGPKEAKIEAGVLSWRPRRSDVGNGTITLRYHAAGERTERSFSFLVSEIPMSLSFDGEAMSTARDGQRAAIWGSSRDANDHSSRLAIVDLATKQRINECSVPGLILAAVIGDDHVYTLNADPVHLLRKGTILDVFHLPDLAHVRTLRLLRPSDELSIAGARALKVTGGVLSLPDLSEGPPQNVVDRDNPILQLSDGWLSGPAVMDETMRAPRFFHRFSASSGVLGINHDATRVLGEPATVTQPLPSPYHGENFSRLARVEVDQSRGAGRIDLILEESNDGGRRVPVACIEDRLVNAGGIRVVDAGEMIAVLVRNDVFLIRHDALGIVATPPVAYSGPVLRPAPNQFILSADEATRLRYAVRGGKPPYRVHCELLTGPMDGDRVPADFVRPGDEPHEFVIDSPALIDALAPDSGLARTLNRWRPLLDVGGGTAREIVDAYTASAGARLESYLERKFDELPIAIPIRVTASDGDGARVQLVHSLILEFPRDRILAILGRELAARRESNDPSELRRRLHARRPQALPEPVLWSVDTSPAAISNRFRAKWPPRTLPNRVTVETMAREIVGSREEFLHDAAPLPDDPPSRLDTLLDLRGATLRFADDFGCLPLQALVDTSGKPLLSWRVCLLPYLGHTDLFHLFRLDEPWDSEHNRKLIPFVPRVFATTGSTLADGHGNVLAVTGPRTAFPSGVVRRLDSLTDPPRETLLFVEVAPNASVIWTKPDDLLVEDDPSVFHKVAKLPMPDPDRQSTSIQGFYAMFGDQEVRPIPFTRNRATLLRAAYVDDGQPSGIRPHDD